MPESVNKGGRPKGSGGAQTKTWLLGKMRDLLESLSPEEFQSKLRALMDQDFSDYLTIMTRLMPKDVNVDATINRFSSWTPDELRQFIETGQYPDHESD